MESLNSSPKPASRKIPRWLLFLLGVPLMCMTTCGLTYWVVERIPQYIEFNIPEMEGMLYWGYTERSILEWSDGPRAFLWRQQGFCFKESCKDWHTVWTHFDKYLTSAGWERVDDKLGTSCDISAPETEFLNIGDNGYVVYVQQERVDDIFCHGPDVCLAIWRTKEEDSYEFVLSSNNPSYLTETTRCLG